MTFCAIILLFPAQGRCDEWCENLRTDSQTQCMQIVDTKPKVSGPEVAEQDSQTKQAKEEKSKDAEKSKDGEKSTSEPKKPRSPKMGLEMARKVMPQDGSGFINDRAVHMLGDAQVNRLMKSGDTTPLRELHKQFNRRSCKLNLTPESQAPVSSELLYLNQRKSVVAIMFSRKHNDHWHVTLAATGFMITADGAMVTNRHVVRSMGTNPDECMFVMTSDAKIHPVKAVLASNEANDVAICQVAGDGFHSLPLRSNTPVGTSVRMISHPKGRLYTLSKGIVSRRYAKSAAKRVPGDAEKVKLDFSKTTNWVTVTADFGKGSSGAPLFDPLGNVIGVAAITNNLTVERKDDTISQMVFRDCVPAEVVLEMIKPVDQP